MLNHAKIAFLEKIITEHERVINKFNDGMMNYNALIFLQKTHRKVIKYINEMPKNIYGLENIKKRVNNVSINIEKIQRKHNR